MPRGQQITIPEGFLATFALVHQRRERTCTRAAKGWVLNHVNANSNSRGPNRRRMRLGPEQARTTRNPRWWESDVYQWADSRRI